MKHVIHDMAFELRKQDRLLSWSFIIIFLERLRINGRDHLTSWLNTNESIRVYGSLYQNETRAVKRVAAIERESGINRSPITGRRRHGENG